MERPYQKCIYFLILGVIYTRAFDDVDLELERGVMGKLLRAMENQTAADTLNLPANASSIRENITDTFSCENRTYGYYADVDNECQVFHVCLPTKTPSGRSVTYRWSFICPNETVFNQEVLVCTRPRDAIDCEDSPNYYDLNMEIGKEYNDTKSETNGIEATMNTENMTNTNKAKLNKESNERNRERIKQQRRKPANKKKQNLKVETLIKEATVEKVNVPDKSSVLSNFNAELFDGPIIEEVNEDIPSTVTEEDFENARIFAERSLKTKSRKLKRGLFRFKADV